MSLSPQWLPASFFVPSSTILYSHIITKLIFYNQILIVSQLCWKPSNGVLFNLANTRALYKDLHIPAWCGSVLFGSFPSILTAVLCSDIFWTYQVCSYFKGLCNFSSPGRESSSWRCHMASCLTSFKSFYKCHFVDDLLSKISMTTPLKLQLLHASNLSCILLLIVIVIWYIKYGSYLVVLLLLSSSLSLFCRIQVL